MSTESSILTNVILINHIAVIVKEDLFDALDPLRHLIDSSTYQDDADSTPQGIPCPDQLTTMCNTDDGEDMPRGSIKSKSELLSVLPHQHFSESDGVLDLTFSIPSQTINAPQVSIKLVVDSAPGCGGIAWPAGQVMPFEYSPHSLADVQVTRFSLVI